MQPAWWLCGIRAHQRKNGLCLHFFLGESCPLALTLMPDSLVPPRMPFKLLPLHWSSDGVNLWAGSLGGAAWDSSSSPSPSSSMTAGFYSQKLRGLLFLTLEPWAGEPGVGLGPFVPQGGISAVETSLPIFICRMCVTGFFGFPPFLPFSM